MFFGTCYCPETLSIVRIHICLYSFVIILKDYKIKNSNRRGLNTAYKILYFSNLKEQLAYFNGTVLSKYIEFKYYNFNLVKQKIKSVEYNINSVEPKIKSVGRNIK